MVCGLVLAVSTQAIVINFTEVGYTNVGSVSVGSVAVGGTATSTTYTVSGVDLDGDSTNDSFTVHIDVSSSNGAISWDAGGDEYDHNGNSLNIGEDMTFEYAGISGTFSGGGTATLNSFTFTEIEMKRWQAFKDAYVIVQSSTTGAVQTANTYALSDDDFTIVPTDHPTNTVETCSFNPTRFNFTVDVDTPLLDDGLQSFETGYTVYQVRTARNSGTYIVGSSYEGTVFGMSTNGEMLWTNELSGFVNHDIYCEDLTGDGVDEILAANADGTLYCLDSNGDDLWQFKTNNALMNAVCVIHSNTTPYVACGGFDQRLYWLTASGQHIKTVHSDTYSQDTTWGDVPAPPPDGEHNVNFLRVMKYPDGSEDLVMHSTVGWSSKGHLYWFDPLADMPHQTDKVDKAFATDNAGYISEYDTDGDGTNEFFMGSSGHRDSACMTKFDPATQTFSMFSITDAFSLSSYSDTHYKVAEPVVIPDGTNYLHLILHGHHILLVQPDMNTNSVEFLKSSYSFYDVCTLPDQPETLILSSVQSGGSCIHLLNTSNAFWKSAFINLEPPGKIATILANTDNVWSNLASFTQPGWENPETVYLMTDQDDLGPLGGYFHDITNNYASPVMLNWLGAFQKQTTNWRTSANGFTNEEYSTRLKGDISAYSLTQQQAVDQFTPHYAGVPGIAAWFGHGNDPNWYQPETITNILDNAAGKITVMLWPETGADFTTNFTFVLDYLFHPVATHAQGRNAIVYFRSKGPQWQSDVYRPHWSRFLSGEFADSFVPALEETGTRSPDLSVAGRMGLWASGAADAWGARAVPDNARYYNQRNHCNQRLLNHFLRNSIYNIACGARYINNFDSTDEYMSILWGLIAKGALYVPQRSEIVSINPVFLGMTEPDARFDAQDRQEKFSTWYDETWEANNPMVISRKGTEWAGSPVTEWDFSRYASGVKERRSDYLPPCPNGIVMIAPPQQGVFADTNAVRGAMVDNLHPMYKSILQQFNSDGRDYISADGTTTYDADTYYTDIEASITNAAKQLPLTVSGDVAWVCAQTASNHLRLTLIDSGYLNPKARTATVTFNTVTPAAMTDMLDDTDFTITDATATVDVPLGLFRFIDIELSEPFFPSNGWGEFASNHGLTGNSQADKDNDGQIDLHEFALGGNPTNPSALGTAPSIAYGADDNVSLFNWESAHTNPGITYIAEWTDNLVSNDWKNTWGSTNSTSTANPAYNETERKVYGGTNDNLFMRLKVSQP